LVATFTTTGSSVRVGTAVQVSGTTPNNFSSPVIYTVTAADGSTQNYTVTVSVTAPTYTVTYDANGGGAESGHGTGTVPSDQAKYPEGATVTVLKNPGNLSRVGYSWEGWSTTKGGDAVTSVEMGNTNLRLYAKWVIRDASGNPYSEVTIGGKVWMVENLKTRKYNDGSNIDQWLPDVYDIPQFYYHQKSAVNGCYYNYFVAVHPNIAPKGWRVPTSTDWYELIQAIKEDAKAIASKTGWETSEESGAVGNNQAANNSTGFNALPAGKRVDGGIDLEGYEAMFWCSDAGGIGGTIYRLQNISSMIETRLYDFNNGVSIRLVREY
jgi:uncharacterized protein (TIGR02145 family)/uncharacterized repeat protein (TIGR02543 family)